MTPGSYLSLVDAWSRTSSRMVTNVLETNRAALAACGLPVDPETDRTEDRIGPADDLAEWEVELQATGDTLDVGDRVRFTKTLTEEDVARFAAATGDTNPLHLDSEWAEETRFGGRIVHGTLAAGLISAALARLPGSVIYLSQDLEFQAPVRLSDRVTADVSVVEDLGEGRFRLRTRVLRQPEGDTLIDGEAVVLIDELPDVDPADEAGIDG